MIFEPITAGSDLSEFTYLALHVPKGSQPFPRSILLKPEIEKYYRGFAPPKDFGLFLVENGQALGAIWARHWAGDKGYGFYRDDWPELTMSLVPEVRGQGLGTELLAAFINMAKDKGSPGLSLSVSQDNAAKKLYLRQGFQVKGKGQDDLLLVLDLTRREE